LDHIPDLIGATRSHPDAEQFESVNWDEFEEVINSQITSITKYRINLANNLNFKDIFKGLLFTHGVAATWYYDHSSSPTQRCFRMGFRPIGLPNLTDAHNEGRAITQHNRVADRLPLVKRSIVNQYSKLQWRGNFNGKEFTAVFDVTNEGGYAGLGKSATVTIEDKITKIIGFEDMAEDDNIKQIMFEHFNGTILNSMAYPNSTVECDMVFSSFTEVAMGKPVLVTDDTIRNPFSGAIGVTNQPGICVGYSMDLGKHQGIQKAQVQIAPGSVYGWGPALRIGANDSTITTPGASGVISVTGLATDPANNEFAGTRGLKTDLAYFDCYIANDSLGVVEVNPNCGCTDYAVIAFRADQTDYTNKLINYTISDVDIDAGTCKLNGDTTNWDVTKEWLVIMADYNHADLQDCQKLYVYFADEDGILVDSDANEYKGHRWV
jgi:hypothetical protein